MSLFDFAAEYGMLPKGELILCALSGGADSVYLLSRLWERREELGYSLAAAHFDHHLRPTSGRDAQFAADFCAARGVPFFLGEGDVAAEAAARGTGLEETARDLRYAFLRETAEKLGASVIATAHNADDNAETLLMNLTRGSGLEGLCGIPPRRGNIVRPLLTTTRTEIEAWLAERGIDHVEDETNTDETYTRNFLRAQVMPLLRQVNPRAIEHMTAAAARLKRDNDVLNANAARVAAEAHKAEDGWVISVKAFEFVPDPIAVRAARQLLLRVGGEQVSAAHLNALVALIRGRDPSAMLHLPSVMVRRVYGDVLFTPWSEEDGPLLEQPLEPDGVTVWGDWVAACACAPCPQNAVRSPVEFWLSTERLAAPLSLRPRREGDELQPPGRPCKTVKKWFIDEKIPRAVRETVPVLWDGSKIAAVGLLGPSEALLAKPGETALHITLQREKGAGDHAS